jgi:hypothetical protein
MMLLTLDVDDADDAHDDGIDKLVKPDIDVKLRLFGEARTAPEWFIFVKDISKKRIFFVFYQPNKTCRRKYKSTKEI